MNTQEWSAALITFFSYLCLVLTGLQSHAMYWWNLATCQQGTKKTYMKPWIARLFCSQASVYLTMEQFSLWASYISISSALDIKYVLFVVHLFCQCLYLHLFCSWYRNTCYLFAFISQCLVACYNTLKLYRSLRGMEEGEWCKWKPFLESPLEQQSPADLPLFWFLVSPFKWVWVVR